ncbi:hypothetical protein SAMN05216464_10243 [Mucilaginibacter pineti]|uniref:Outer membrane protein beta-barrel domain-containing protein n=1 Tax=Mucilaginibacter pineti TaxID=1391627 RepID=A0A1G6W3P6_9SPHI|nr:hypothetical protein [Mucilaginibacter pineti]SDD60502.1 hypothetical protein SAMN05216464_10243 [Mucilaginibacter pineti]
MKKILLALVILGGTAFSSFAQTSSSSSPADAAKFSIGFDGGLPTGKSKNFYSVVLGGSLKYEMPIASSTLFTISAGYSSFQPKKEFKDAGLHAAGFIPLKAGIKYYFNEGFYGEGQLGAVFSTGSDGGTAFVYAPGIGYTIEGGFDIGVRYEGWAKSGTISQVALRVAYNF